MGKAIHVLLLWSLIAVQLAIALPSAVQPRAISSDLLATFNYFEQYAASSYCANNDDNYPGNKITCSAGTCPLVEAENTTTFDEFQNSLFTDVTGFVAVDSEKWPVVVSFRGSVSVRNWFSDFAFPQVPTDICPGCLAHVGWWTAWFEARAGVLSSITGICDKYPGYQLVVTGHSAGGAIATLATAELRNMGYSAALYTFGAPRIGGPTISQFITNQLGVNFRITHSNDPVPNVPPIWLGYDHISPEYWITSGNQVTVTANNIQVCTGLTNIQCNAGQLIPNVLSHLWYFNSIAGCDPSILSLRHDDMFSVYNNDVHAYSYSI